MTHYILRRLMEAVPVLLVVSVIVFVLMRALPGDPLAAFITVETGTLPAAERAALEKQIGLDKPILVQYVVWVGQFVSGDWGRSLSSHQLVATTVRERVGVTLQLATIAWFVGVAVAIPIGVLSALKRNTWLDAGITTLALTGVATPSFLLGLILILVFGVYLHALPTHGFVSFFDDPFQAARHLVLPMIALSTGLMASIVRQTRSGVLEVLNEDYVRTARAKGLANRQVILRHVLKNALLPVVTIAGIQLGNLVSGAIIVESMFALSGMGSLIIQSVVGRDYPTIQVVVIFTALFTVAGNLIADITYVLLDPRIRL